jgi:hypothetical protein
VRHVRGTGRASVRAGERGEGRRGVGGAVARAARASGRRRGAPPFSRPGTVRAASPATCTRPVSVTWEPLPAQHGSHFRRFASSTWRAGGCGRRAFAQAVSLFLADTWPSLPSMAPSGVGRHASGRVASTEQSVFSAAVPSSATCDARAVQRDTRPSGPWRRRVQGWMSGAVHPAQAGRRGAWGTNQRALASIPHVEKLLVRALGRGHGAAPVRRRRARTEAALAGCRGSALRAGARLRWRGADEARVDEPCEAHAGDVP